MFSEQIEQFYSQTVDKVHEDQCLSVTCHTVWLVSMNPNEDTKLIEFSIAKWAKDA